MVHVFLLDRSNLNYYTCCGRIHVKLALLGLIVFSIILQIIDLIALFQSEATKTVITFQIMEIIMIPCNIMALTKEKAGYLIPFMFQMFLAFLGAALTSFRVAISILIPNSIAAKDFLEIEPSFFGYFSALLLLAVLVTLTTFFAWSLHVILSCHKYFEDKTAERATFANRLNFNVEKDSSDTSENVQPNTSRDSSFGNPNFDIEGDENIFPTKSVGPVMV
ncbi:unnamed protein product [Auanema sp. JU1783]|nr:unnamed protein product [Auanema sp. JU1783]